MKNSDQVLSVTARNKYSPQFKEQDLERTKQDGVPKAAKDLGIAQAMLYRPKAVKPVSRLRSKSFSKQESPGLSEKMLAWKRKSLFKKAASYFAKQPWSTAWTQKIGQEQLPRGTPCCSPLKSTSQSH